MHADRPASEYHDQAVSTPDDQGPNKAKSYECSFCKKGFSNAQALGGHMNIHRKEKARLKEAPNERQSCTRKTVKPLELPSIPDKSTPDQPWDFSSSEDYCSLSPRNTTHEGEVKQLPVFDETAPRSNKPEPNIQAPKCSEEGLPSSQAELDLELRLGHKPLKSSATTRARKFF